MNTLWTICAWTGAIWWCCALIAGPWLLAEILGHDSDGEPIEWDNE